MSRQAQVNYMPRGAIRCDPKRMELTFVGQAGVTLRAEFDDCAITAGSGKEGEMKRPGQAARRPPEAAPSGRVFLDVMSGLRGLPGDPQIDHRLPTFLLLAEVMVL